MADDLQKLERQIAKLDTAMGSGVLTIESPDTGRVTYRSYDEMERARAALIRRRDAVSPTGARRRTRQVAIVSSGGW